MKTIKIETLSGKKFIIENVGSAFSLQTEDGQEIGLFSVLAVAMQQALSLS